MITPARIATAPYYREGTQRWLPPPTPPKPLLEDPVHEKEIFASEVYAVGLVHGNIAITLASIRFDEAIGDEQPKARRIVTGKVILTNPAAGQLVQMFQHLIAQLEAAARQPTSQEPS